MSKTGSEEGVQWTVSGADNSEMDIELDAEKAQSWFDTLGSLTTSLWYDETRDLEQELGSRKIAVVKITHGFDTAVIDIFEIPPKDDEESASYYGKTSENPYPFELTLYTMKRLNKNLEELVK